MIKEVFIQEVLPAISTGTIKIKEFDEIFNEEVEFTYNVHYKIDKTDDINTPVLVIRNEELFYQKLEEYVNSMLKTYPKPQCITEHEYLKKILALTFNNATYGDFLNPEIYLQKRIDFLSQVVPLELLIINSSIPLLNVKMVSSVKKQSMMLETPYVYEMILKTDKYEYQLPRISFGISEDTCYIYGIQDKKQEITEDIEFLQNKIKQEMKMSNQAMNDEYSAYYRKKLRNVTPSFVLELGIFLNKMYEIGIHDIKVVPFLPIRYYAKAKASKVIASSKATNEEEYEQLLSSLDERQLNIQRNITDKFMRTFERLEYMTDLIYIELQPFELDDMMHIKLQQRTRCDNLLLQQAIEQSILPTYELDHPSDRIK